jgi:hypothetical protein
VESTIENATKSIPWMKNLSIIKRFISFKLVNSNHFNQELMQWFKFPTITFFIQKVSPLTWCSSLLTPIKGPQIFLSTIVDDFFSYTLDLNTITFDIRMRGEISKKEVERFAREQQEMKRL